MVTIKFKGFVDGQSDMHLARYLISGNLETYVVEFQYDPEKNTTVVTLSERDAVKFRKKAKELGYEEFPS